MGVQVSYFGVDFRNIKPHVLAAANDEALNYIGEEIKYDTEEYVPMDTGMLRNSATVSAAHGGEMEIQYSRLITYEDSDGNVHTIDGAEWVYNGLNPVRSELSGGSVPIINYTTPGTGPFWFERATEEHLKEWKKEFTFKFIDSFT